MSRFNIGNISFWISPVSVMKCFVGIGWVVRGTEAELSEYQTFYDEFFPFLIKQDNEMCIDDFCENLIKKIDETMEKHGLKSDLVTKFSQRLKNTLKDAGNRRNASQFADKYSKWLSNLHKSSFGQVADLAAKKLEEWGVHPLRESLGAVASFGSAIFGKYVPSLQAVCVQMDTVSKSECSEIQFIETLLHEEVHAVIHHNMGEEEKRCELSWLDELTAVLTSQYAIKSATLELRDIGDKVEYVNRCLESIRNRQRYGELANAVLRDTEDPLIAWKAWEKIFKLCQEDKHNYAKERIIKPILHELGWQVEFPYKYGDKYVTVFV